MTALNPVPPTPNTNFPQLASPVMLMDPPDPFVQVVQDSAVSPVGFCSPHAHPKTTEILLDELLREELEELIELLDEEELLELLELLEEDTALKELEDDKEELELEDEREELELEDEREEDELELEDELESDEELLELLILLLEDEELDVPFKPSL